MSRHETSSEFISITEAARMLPSHRPGKRVRLATLYRWINDGKLPAYRRGRWYFVKLADLQALTQPVTVKVKMRLPVSNRRRQAAEDWAQKTLREDGFIR